MKPVLYLTALAAMSFLAAGFPGPVDPLSTMFFAATIFPVALISFVLGIRFGPAAPQGQRKGLYITISVLIVVTIIGAVAEFQRVASALSPQTSSSSN
jgi:low affinity Fe/Cu permease